LRELPSIDALLRTPEARLLSEQVGTERLTNLARTVTSRMRAALLLAQEENAHDTADGRQTRAGLMQQAVRELERACEREAARRLRRVINATGVILHTNLGRAPLAEPARRAISDEAARYCTLEYDSEAGARGQRGARVEHLLAELTGAEAALVVNNCAAAALLVLTALAKGGTAIVSRGELVEIGGDFRVPDIMTESGTRLSEVGTTNRTRLSDYERAVDADTRLIMRVHTSNYRIIGFTATPSLRELADAAHRANLPLYEDAGSGALIDLLPYGIEGEPLIRESIESGADLVTFSGDKLLGSAQAGLVVGRKEFIDRLRRHPLYRALRADKLRLAALESTLEIYRRGLAPEQIPVISMLALTREEIRGRASRFLSRVRQRLNHEALSLEVVPGHSAVGGGAAPATNLQTSLIALAHNALTPAALELRLRQNSPPVITRILEDRVLIDLRTVSIDEEEELMSALVSLPA
jgi:L-seryl-tRNA(Ser) seleniumtransferase